MLSHQRTDSNLRISISDNISDNNPSDNWKCVATIHVAEADCIPQ